jgi:hypothetical protein
MKRHVKIWQDERGNVESSLALIPLLILFLTSLQLIVAVGYRNADTLQASDDASVRAISGEFSIEDTEITILSPDRFSNISLLVTRYGRKIPELVPGLRAIIGRDFETNLNGIAVIENTR